MLNDIISHSLRHEKHRVSAGGYKVSDKCGRYVKHRSTRKLHPFRIFRYSYIARTRIHQYTVILDYLLATSPLIKYLPIIRTDDEGKVRVSKLL